MSREKPIFGIDVSNYQRGIDMKRVSNLGYKFVLVKATEGPYPGGGNYINPSYDTQIRGAMNNGMLIGAYHFLVRDNAKAQADHFLKKVRDTRGKLLVVDFEEYPAPYQHLTPGNDTLKNFVAEVKRRAGKEVIIYSGQGFWNGGDSSGRFGQYGADAAWDAYYPAGFRQLERPKDWYKANWNLGWGRRWGGVEPLFWQFTPAGKVAGMYLDVNAFRGSMDRLIALKQGGKVIREPQFSVVPAGFTPKPVRHNSARYDERHPTRYEYRDDVEDLIRRVFKQFGGWANLHINTYVCHPPHNDPRYACRDTTSFDIWGPRGRGDAIGFEKGQKVFDYIFNDPNPPYIEWCIWRRRIWIRGVGWRPYGSNSFEWHDDHPHFTIAGPSRRLV